MMKTVIVGALGTLLAGGVLFARDNQTSKVDSLSYFERIGLETQSPRVHTKGMDRHKKYDQEGVAKEQTRAGYRTVSTHDTVNAFIPMGK